MENYRNNSKDKRSFRKAENRLPNRAELGIKGEKDVKGDDCL